MKINGAIARNQARNYYEDSVKMNSLWDWVDKQSKDGKFNGRYSDNFFNEDELSYIRSLGFCVSNTSNGKAKVTLPYYNIFW